MLLGFAFSNAPKIKKITKYFNGYGQVSEKNLVFHYRNFNTNLGDLLLVAGFAIDGLGTIGGVGKII